MKKEKITYKSPTLEIEEIVLENGLMTLSGGTNEEVTINENIDGEDGDDIEFY